MKIFTFCIDDNGEVTFAGNISVVEATKILTNKVLGALSKAKEPMKEEGVDN